MGSLEVQGRRWLTMAVVAFGLVLLASTANAQNEPWRETDVRGLELEVTSQGSFQQLDLKVTNKTAQRKTLRLGHGTFFNPGSDALQPLVITANVRAVVEARQTIHVTVKTACMDAAKGVSESGYTQWERREDKGLGALIHFYQSQRELVAAATGPQHHDTEEERARFLQMMVWAYQGNNEADVESFALKYMFDGDAAATRAFMTSVYPFARIALEVYKAGGRGPGEIKIRIPF